MLDTATKKRIDDCRDILVGKLPDPKAQIEQITIGLIYKFMDDMDKEAIELGGKVKFFADYKIPDPQFPNDRKKDKLVEFSKYRWDHLFDTKVTATEMLGLYSEAIMGMDKNPNIPQLFRDIFKNAYLPYRDPETLKLFLKTISEFEYSHSEKLGDAFEYLLSVMGSQGDAGQFRTPRHIIDFLVAVVDPGKNDTILDPACGTAGFLISAFKHIKEKNKKGLTPDERKKLIQNFVGYDISPDMVRLSLVNLYLHGFSDPHIWEYDTLSSEDRWAESYDVILANPPFMSPKGGIRPHKKFTISSNRSEVLFVDYIAEHLNPKGRAGIIVPEGVIFQSGTAYKDLRKMLVTNYLYAVVSLPAGVFNPYSGVKTSILLMDKELAKNKKEILFVKIDNDGYGLGAQRTAVKGGQLQEAVELLRQFKEGKFIESEIAHAVAKKEIAKNGDYNLSGERYKEHVQLQTSFPVVDFEDSIEKVVYTNKIKSSDYKESGHFPIIDQSDNFIAGFWDDPEDVFKIKKPVTIFGDHTRCFKYVDFDFVLGADGVKILQPSENFISKFYYYLIRDIQINNLGYSRHFKELKDKKIPLPPLSIQKAIVAEIEDYQKIIDGAKMVVNNYKPHIDIDPEWEMVELGEVCEKIQIGPFGTQLHKSDYSSSGIPIINPKHIVDSAIFPNEMISIKKANSLPQYFLRKGDIIMGRRGEMGRVAYISKEQDGWFCGTGSIIIRLKKSYCGKLYALYLSDETTIQYLKNNSRGVTMDNLNKDIIERLPIPKMSTHLQSEILSKIEKEQVLVNASKQLIAIYEQKIKDRIAKVWGANKKEGAVYEENEVVTLAAEE